MRQKIATMFATLALLLGIGLASAAPASAGPFCPDSALGPCGEIINASSSQCTLTSYKNWTQAYGGYGYNGSVLYPGVSSKRFHVDADGLKFSTKCKWKVHDGTQMHYYPVGTTWAKNRWGQRWVAYGTLL